MGAAADRALPPERSPLGAAARSEREKWETEAARAGNSTDDLAADWQDYAAAGITGEDDLTPRALDVLN